MGRRGKEEDSEAEDGTYVKPDRSRGGGGAEGVQLVFQHNLFGE